MTDAVWTDDALLSGEEDTLGRLPYAQRAAELIHSTQSFRSSAVFGLSGPWGSGKTSLVNMIVEELQTAHREWAVARFTPWATSDISGLLGEFYAALAEALPRKRGKNVRRALSITAAVAAPAANVIPVAGGAASAGVKMAADALTKAPSWQSAFDKAAHKLKELKLPILVVVDDIDRLHSDELMALLKVVRLLGRFDGVQYLLAYDDETLYRSMSASSTVSPHDGTAERFMEKIVQYPLFVPPILRHQQLARLNAGFGRVLRQYSEDDPSYRVSGLIDCFLALLTTPRAIDRYIAQLHHHIPLLPPDEVDDEDVQVLTLVRVSFPSLFNALPMFRDRLISGHIGEIKSTGSPLEYEPFDINALLELVPLGKRDVARELLTSLFPKLHVEGQIATHASPRRQSIQHEEYFDRYFAMGILDHDISDADVQAAVTSAAAGEPADLTKLLLETTGDRRGLVLSKGANPDHHPTMGAGRIQLSKALASIANHLPSEDALPFSHLDQVLIWIADLLAELPKDTASQDLGVVIDQLADAALQIRAWKRVGSAVRRTHQDDAPPWFNQTTARLVVSAATSVVEHLQGGDDAELRFGVGYQIHFVLRHDPDLLRTPVRELLDAKEISLSVLASRIVSVRTILGTKPDWQLSPDFDQETFNQIAPPGDDPWYHEPAESNVDIRDLSWANRRRFVTGKVDPPPAST
ncbi:KAP family NTPase [Luteipulveratus mongoliensis]|nr:KAP family NTPase [Luteipulveratus mongoliensis]